MITKRLALRIYMRIIKRVISRKIGLTSKKIIEEIGVANRYRGKRCKLLISLAKDMKTTKLLFL